MVDRRKLVLIANDDQAVREALQFALRLEGLWVHVHGGAATMLADPDVHRAGCVVLDDQIARSDGFALLNDLRALNINLPAIMLTSHATPRLQARADAAGVQKLLEKPLLDNALIDNLRSILID